MGQHQVINMESEVEEGESELLKLVDEVKIEQEESDVSEVSDKEVKLNVEATDKKKKPEFQAVFCEVCCVSLNSSSQATAHFNGKTHQNKSKVQSPVNNSKKVIEAPSIVALPPALQESLKCELCHRTFNSGSQLQAHVTGKAHMLLAKSRLENPSIILPPPIHVKEPVFTPIIPKKKHNGVIVKPDVSFGSNLTRLFHCAKCNITLNSQKQMDQHNKGLRHKIVIGKAKTPENVSGEKWENVRYTKIANAVLGINRDTITGSGGGMNLREFYCEKCDITVNSQTQLDQHLESQKHQTRGLETNNMQNKRKRDYSGISHGASFKTGKYQSIPYKKPALHNYQSNYETKPPSSYVPPPLTATNFVHGNEQFANDGFYTTDQVHFLKQYQPKKFSQNWNHNFIY